MWYKKKFIIFSFTLGKEFFYSEAKFISHDAVLFFEAHRIVTTMS